MGNQNCCQKRQDEIDGYMPPVGSILRPRYDGDEENECDRTNMDVAALIREEHEKQRLRQSHIAMLDESIRIHQFKQSSHMDEQYLSEMKEAAMQNRRSMKAGVSSERKRSFQNMGRGRPQDLQNSSASKGRSGTHHQRLSREKGSAGQNYQGQRENQQQQDYLSKSFANNGEAMMAGMLMDDDEMQFVHSQNRMLVQRSSLGNPGQSRGVAQMRSNNNYNDGSLAIKKQASRNSKGQNRQSLGKDAPNNSGYGQQKSFQDSYKQGKDLYGGDDPYLYGDYVPQQRVQLQAMVQPSDPRSSKDRSSNPTTQRVESNGAQYTNSTGLGNHRGQSTDVSSLPKSIPKSTSDVASQDGVYMPVKLTKEVLHMFEESTRLSSVALIQEYLHRCSLEPGEIEGLLTSGSSGNSKTSSSDEESEVSYDNEEGENGQRGENNGPAESQAKDQNAQDQNSLQSFEDLQRKHQPIEKIAGLHNNDQIEEDKVNHSHKKNYYRKPAKQ